MVDSNPLANSSPEPQFAANLSELEQRLGLYQVFLNLYEHHRELLDEILDLENTDRYQIKGVWQYIQANIEEQQVYLVTNLLQGQTQKFLQPQNCWVIGRDRKVSLCIQDKRLSRRHAVIQYIQGQGFYLSDLNSTNGTYLNSEPVRRPVLLREGDRIRLGSLAFIFFISHGYRELPAVDPDLSHTYRLPQPASPEQQQADGTNLVEAVPASEELPAGSEKETFMFPQPLASDMRQPSESGATDLSTAQKADILDRFLNR